MLWARSLTQRLVGRATALAVVAMAICPVAAPAGVHAARPQGASIATTTALTSSANPSQFGQTVTFTATVTTSVGGTPVTVGSVTFQIDGGGDVVVPVGGGVATLTTSTLSAGPHTIVADYGGDATFAQSAGSLTQTVDRANATTAVTSSPNPSFVGEPVTFTATVSFPAGTAAAGTVTFVDGPTVLGTVPVNAGGQAALTTNALAAGSHTINATFNGTADINASNATLIQQVNEPTATTTTFLSSPNPSQFGQLVTLTATVTAVGGGTPVGVVDFAIFGGTVIGNDIPLVGGQASFQTSTLAVGTNTISATFIPGDSSFASSTSIPIDQVVTPAQTSTTVTSSLNPSFVGDPVTLTATVSPAFGGVVTGGTVTFVDGPTVLGTVPVVGGVAMLTTSTLAAGSHTINVSFNGTAEFLPSGAIPLTQQVNEPAPTTASTSTTTTSPTTTPPDTTAPSSPSTSTSTTTTSSTAPGVVETVTELSSSANPSTLGQPVTFTATVTPVGGSGFAPVGLRSTARPRQVAEGGSVTISDGDTVLATVAVEGGQASFTTSSLTAGAHTITAAFSGTATAAPSSATIVQQVNQPAPLPATR